MGKPDDHPFKPAMSRMESKARATDEAFRAITKEEIAKRDQKTARLRAIRLAREAANREAQPSKAPNKIRGGRARKS